MTGNKINWQDLAADLAASNGMPRKEAEAFVRAFFDTLAQGIMEEKSVKVKALGTFKMVDVQERESVNVNTGERITISGHAKIGFLPDSALKELVNKPFADFQTVILNDATSTEEMDKIDRKYPANAAEVLDDAPPSATSEDMPNEDNVAQEEPATSDAVDTPEAPAPSEPAPDTPTCTSEADQAAEEATMAETGDEASSKTPTAEDDDIAEATDETEPTEDTQEGGGTASEPQQPTEAAAPTQACDAEPANAIAVDTASPTGAAQAPQPATADPSVPATTPVTTSPAPPSQPTHNIWRTSFLTLVVLLLMVACYMVGYLRLIDLSWLCLPPAEPMTEVAEQPIPVPTKAAPVQDTATAPASKPATQESSTPTAQEPSKPQDTPEAQPAAPATQREHAASPSTQDNKQRLMQAAGQYPQVKSGKYLITGVRKTITVQQGDNLCRIARREYGDKGVVEYIKVLNRLTDPDNITVGDKVKLPELTAKSE